MRTRCAALVVLLVAGAACGASPSAPEASSFQLTPGTYRLSFTGTSCFLATIGSPSTPNPSTIELPVVLSVSGGGFALTAPPHAISGQITATSSTVAGTIAGSAVVGVVRFHGGPADGAPIGFGGVAREGERFEGQLTAGQANFTVTDPGGTSTAFCTGAAFMLRRG